MSDVEVRVRRYQPSDREAAILLAPRLETGVASWRDTDAVRRAVTGWIESSLANADAEDREVFVAHAGGDVIGLVTVAQRPHPRCGPAMCRVPCTRPGWSWGAGRGFCGAGVAPGGARGGVAGGDLGVAGG